MKRLLLLLALLLATGCYTAKPLENYDVKTHYYIDKWGKSYYFFEAVSADSLMEKDK